MGKIKVGDTFQSTSCNTFTVIEVKNQSNIVIKFNDKFGHKTTTTSDTVRSGMIKNPYFPKIFNKGYFGVGLYKAKVTVDSEVNVEYRTWMNMLSRCYDPNYISTKAGYGCYSGVKVTDEWLNFQVFAEWYCVKLAESQLKSQDTKFVLDKDLFSTNEKIYSPETCCLIPEQLNLLMVNNTTCNKTKKLSVIHKRKNGTYSVTLSFNKKSKTFSGYKTEKECFDLYLNNKEKSMTSLIESYKSTIDHRVYLALIEYVSKNSITLSTYYDH